MVKEDDWSDQFIHSEGVSRLFTDIEKFDNQYDGSQTFFTVVLDTDDLENHLFFPIPHHNDRIEEKEPNEPCQICQTLTNEMHSVPYLSMDPHGGITDLDLYKTDICRSCLDTAKAVRDSHKSELGPQSIAELI